MDEKLKNLDKNIIELLSERFNVYSNELKARLEADIPLFSPEEMVELNNHIDAVNSGPLPGDLLMRIFNELVSYSREMAEPVKVAYLGPAGSYSHSAMLEVFGESVREVPGKTIHDVFMDVEMKRVNYAVVPIENSTEGIVTVTHDELLEAESRIVAEKYLRISHNLVSVSDDIGKVKKLYAHPQTLGQCQEWLRKNLPNVEIYQVSSTSLAAETASWDKFSAAISSDASARIHNMKILHSHIEDSKQNYTRFFVVGHRDNAPTGNDKTSVICAVKDHPGALYAMLKPFNDAGINMTKIESRPDRKKMWEYNFFIDFIGHKDTTVVKQAMEKMKKELIYIKVLGSYPAGNKD